MGSFGEHLRREREMRGVGLEEIATATKISTRNLRALEEEKFDQLPGGIFNKGFVRAYAKFLGIDQDQIVAEYESASQDTELTREQKLKEDFAKAEFRKQRKDDQEISLEPKSQWGTIAVIVLIAAIGYGGYSYYQRRKLDRLQQAQTPPASAVQPAQQTQPPPALPAANAQPPFAGAPGESASTPSSTATPSADGTAKTGEAARPDATKTSQSSPTETSKPASQKSDTPPASATPKPAGEQKPANTASASAPFELKIKVNKQSWVSIKADGKTLVSTTLAPGTEKTFKATDKIEMIVGNAGGVEISYNGKPVENLNTGQDVRKLTFTPSGYE